jgi:glycine oxidase
MGVMAFDVIVTGAGIIGASIAWRLAQRGLRIVLVDAGRMGGEASSAGAGMLAPGGEIEERSAWNDLALESLRLYPGFVAELESETGQPIDYQQLGAVEVALSGGEWRGLEARGRRQASLGIPSCPLSDSDLRKQAPLLRGGVAGALLYPRDALVDPRSVVRALRYACLERRVEIREGVRVTAIRPKADAVEVSTSHGTLDAAAAVLAAGAWSSHIPVAGVALRRAYPVRGHLIGFQLPAGSLGPILRHGHTYLLQRAGGFTIAGTSSEYAGFDRTLDPAILSDIRSRAAVLLPVLAGLSPDEQWLGFRPAVEGDSPVIGRAGETALWLAYGHHRNGILMAPATAARIAGAIMTSSEKDSSGRSGTP